MRAALAFLTPLPLGRGAAAVAPSPSTLAWFPVAGLVIGAVVGGVWWGAAEAFPLLVAGAVAVVADVVATGALHVDGLADSADGLLPHLDGPDRRRGVMAGPDVGAFGVAAVVGVLALRWAALASVEPTGWRVLAVAALWCASRSLMAAALVGERYVGGGLGAAFVPQRWAGAARAVLLVLALPAIAGYGVVLLARRRLGGVTGDVLGAAGLVGETVALVALTAW